MCNEMSNHYTEDYATDTMLKPQRSLNRVLDDNKLNFIGLSQQRSYSQWIREVKIRDFTPASELYSREMHPTMLIVGAYSTKINGARHLVPLTLVPDRLFIPNKFRTGTKCSLIGNPEPNGFSHGISISNSAFGSTFENWPPEPSAVNLIFVFISHCGMDRRTNSESGILAPWFFCQ